MSLNWLKWFTKNSDVGENTQSATIRKPIHMVRKELTHPITVCKGDHLHVTWGREFVRDGDKFLLKKEETLAEFEIEQAMRATHATKFEVVDEFGYDVGVGVVIGGTKL